MGEGGAARVERLCPQGSTLTPFAAQSSGPQRLPFLGDTTPAIAQRFLRPKGHHQGLASTSVFSGDPERLSSYDAGCGTRMSGDAVGRVESETCQEQRNFSPGFTSA